MSTEDHVQRLKDHVVWYRGRYRDLQPIYEIQLFTTLDGAFNGMGFYYNLDDAVIAMHENVLDIRETVFNYGFILCKFPGLYQCADTEARIFFQWDEERQGFYEADEPECFEHLGFM